MCNKLAYRSSHSLTEVGTILTDHYLRFCYVSGDIIDPLTPICRSWHVPKLLSQLFLGWFTITDGNSTG
jgi:hypothetical protein